MAVESRLFVERGDGVPGALGVEAADPSMVRSKVSAVAVMRSP
jgi:hypothetical protein